MRKLVILIPPFIVVGAIGLFYGYCYVAEHTILGINQDSIRKSNRAIADVFTLQAKCKAASIGSFAPYVSIKLNGSELLTAKVNQGYDTLGDCMRSSIDGLEFIEQDRLVRISMKDRTVKEITLIYP